MRTKSLLFFVFSIISFTAFAQQGAIKARVVSRSNRTPLSGVVVVTNPTTQTTTTDNNGYFSLENLDPGRYIVSLKQEGYQDQNLAVNVEDSIKNLYTLVLVPKLSDNDIDDALFAQFSSDNVNDAMSVNVPFSTGDLFSESTSYKFSEMYFSPRGYDSKYSDVYLNGIRMNDALTGEASWSLWSGLNEATRNQETSSGLNTFAYGLGGLGGSTNILARASHVRKGWTASLVSTNSMYRLRAMITYASGMRDDGWAYAFSLSTRQGNNSYIDGVYYNTYGYFASVEKKINEQHLLSFTVLGSPSERGMQAAATQETYDLVGSNYYNANLGYQDGELRNTRVKEYHEPVAMLNYSFDISDQSQLNIASSFRFGQNGYSSLTWFSGRDPRPDYYRYLPSYDYCPNPAEVAENWMLNTENIQYIDFDNMYQSNYNGTVDQTYGDGNRSNYMIEERHTDQRDFNFAAQFSHIFDNNSQIFSGLNFRRNRTEYYSEVKDLLGGDYWVDVDKFAERDFADNDVTYQNNLAYYYQYGYAQAVSEGDKYNYDYYANVVKADIWADYNIVFSGAPALSIALSGELGYSSMWRDGLWCKGLFEDNSYGSSEKLNYLTYKGKLNASYRFNRSITASANAAYITSAPSFQSAFVSPRTRNSVTPGIDTEKSFSIDGALDINYDFVQFRIAAYYTNITDQTDVISFYNDLMSSYDNFAMSGIDSYYKGLELAISVPIAYGISINSAASLGDYRYNSNPYFIEMADNSETALAQGSVNWSGFHVESTPQTAVNLGLSYRSQDYLFASLDVNCYDDIYISMNPLARTDDVITTYMTSEDIALLRKQEKFDRAYVVNASIGKSWFINRKYNLGVNFQINNILNSQDIKTGGYEQMRLNEVEDDSGNTESYTRFDSKYYYMLGRTYYLNVYLRF